MNFKSLVLFLTALSLFALESLAQENRFVTAPNGLICRAAPSSDADRVGKVPYGSVVELIETTNVQYEMLDNGKKISGSWVKVRVSYTSYLFSLMDAKKLHDEGMWSECYVFDGYLEVLNKATVQLKSINEKQFKQLQQKSHSPKLNPTKIVDFDSIKSALGNRATWIMADEYDFLILDSFKLSNGRQYKINQESNDYGVAAYYPTEEVLMLVGGHESDFSISFKTGEVIETVGNPDYIVNSPNNKFRLTGFYPGQECSSYFFQEINNGEFRYLVDFGWGSTFGEDVCNFKTFVWTDDTHFAYSFLDYSVNSEKGEMRYLTGEIVLLDGRQE